MAASAPSPPSSSGGAGGMSLTVASFKAQLTQLSSGGVAHRDLGDRYRSVLESILLLGEDELVEGLKVFIEAIVNENVSLVISRQLLTEVGNHLSKMQDAVAKAVAHYTLEIVQPRYVRTYALVKPRARACSDHISVRPIKM